MELWTQYLALCVNIVAQQPEARPVLLLSDDAAYYATDYCVSLIYEGKPITDQAERLYVLLDEMHILTRMKQEEHRIK